MNAAVFGIGYVDLVQAAVLAEVGRHVCCVDTNADKIEKPKQVTIPIYEPGLTPLVQSNYEAGRITFTTNAEEGVNFSKIQFVAVGTPPDEDDAVDPKYVLSFAKTIVMNMQTPKIIVDKSTVPVGTVIKLAEYISAILAQRKVKHVFQFISNTELQKKCSAVNDCIWPDRIVIRIDEPQTDRAAVTHLQQTIRLL
jgi:UDPglucose 6-dehydrogenase